VGFILGRDTEKGNIKKADFVNTVIIAKMICPICKRVLTKGEIEVMSAYKFEKCIECRKKEQLRMRVGNETTRKKSRSVV
jgi:hypothetical protein